jgi:predicted small secreted protein
MKTGLLTALAAATVVLAGCKDSTGSGGDIASGSLAFGYAGARSGAFSTSGGVRAQNGGGFTKEQFATAVKFTDPDGTSVAMVAYLPVTASTGHEVVFAFASATAGQSLALTDDCITACALGIVVFDTDPDLEEDDSEAFFFTSGTLQVASVSGGRIRGTFSGTAEDLEGTRTITVSAGTFDVPLVDQSRFPAPDRSAPRPEFQRLRRGMAPR